MGPPWIFTVLLFAMTIAYTARDSPHTRTPRGGGGGGLGSDEVGSGDGTERGGGVEVNGSAFGYYY